MGRLRLSWPIGIFVTFGCLSDSVHYSPAEDTDAFAKIANTWSVAGGPTISLCEDVNAPADDNDCQVEHTVRGGGRGSSHEESHGGVGCGGCPFDNVAYVTGRVSGGGLAPDTMVTGEIKLGGGAGDDPYALPYYVTLGCVDTNAPCFISGTIEEDGTFHADSWPNTVGGAGTLEWTAEAVCP